MHITRRERQRRSLNMTSLIDVMFILLLFFMLSTSFVQSESMELALPSDKAPPSKAVKEGVVHILIGNDGTFYIGQKAVAEADLQDQLMQLFQESPDKKVMLWSAGNVPVQMVVTAMDKVYLAGGKKISVSEWNQATGGT